MDGGPGVGGVTQARQTSLEAVVAGAALLVLRPSHHVPQLGGERAGPGAAGVAWKVFQIK